MPKRTIIKGEWVVGWGEKGHEVLEGGCVVVEGYRIVFVGWPDDHSCPRAESTIDAKGKIVLPGIINMHCVANIDLQVLGIDGQASGGGYNRPAWTIDPSTPHIFTDEEFRTSAYFSVASILKGGAASFGSVVTGATKKWEDEVPEMHALAEACEGLGARAWLAHTYQETSDYTEPDGTHRIIWDRKKADQGLQHAIEFIEYLKGRGEGRLTGFLFPKRTERCSDDLLKETLRQSKILGGVHVRTHFAHSLQEQRNFKAKAENRGRTMVEWLRDIGFLGPNICLTHAIFIAGHSATGEKAGEDLGILADSRTNVCHCPVVYARSGVFMESFSRYVAAGINMSLGTDTFPTDLLEEMRIGSLVCKVVDRKRESGMVREFFDAVTVNPAKSLCREDLGRLAAGCKADVSIFNLPVMEAGPVDDPLRNLVHHANRLNCDTVMVDGKVVVEGGRVVGLDEEELGYKAQRLWEKYKSSLVGWDYKKRPAEQVFPPTLPVRRRG